MSGGSGFTSPGDASYASNTLHVGDGTWDLDRDTFLLPNLMGVNFETMRYNGGLTMTANSFTLFSLTFL